jgi:hypothetical protein
MNINIIQLDRTADIGGVITVHWTATKSDGEYTASGYGAEGFEPDPESPDFKPFDELTEVDVIGWLEGKEGWAAGLEQRLNAELERLKNPPVLHGLPWSQSLNESNEE